MVGFCNDGINGITSTKTSFGKCFLRPSLAISIFSSWTLFTITAKTFTSFSENESYVICTPFTNSSKVFPTPLATIIAGIPKFLAIKILQAFITSAT